MGNGFVHLDEKPLGESFSDTLLAKSLNQFYNLFEGSATQNM